MLKIVRDNDIIEIRFDHKTCDEYEIENMTGMCVDGHRKCSFATAKLNDKIVGRGISVCHPDDNFCKSTGRKKALVDAIFSFSKSIRKMIWEQYKIRCKFRK